MAERLARLLRAQCAVAFAVVLLCAGAARAQSGGGYDLSRNTVDGGGGSFSNAGGYRLGGTVGQADAGSQLGGGFTLNGGFWFVVGGAPTSTPTATATLTHTRTASPTQSRT